MHTVTVDNIDVYQAIDLKNQIIQTGLIQDRDFEWAWITAEWSPTQGWTRQKHAEFRFQDPALATFYQLKWSR